MRNFARNIFLTLAGFFKRPKSGIHIVNSHYVTPRESHIKNDSGVFENYLKFLALKGKLTNIENVINDLVNHNFVRIEPEFVFTFDDGFQECYTVIAPILEKFNCRGVFFINSNYIQSSASYQIEFNKRIHLTSKVPMNWHQVIDLHRRGHTIGSHTLDHFNLSYLTNEEIAKQIGDNKRMLEDKLNYKCDHFAWTYGRMSDFPDSALLEAEKHHKYIYSSANYKKYFSTNNRIINRRHLEPFWPKSHINYFLSVLKD